MKIEKIPLIYVVVNKLHVSSFSKVMRAPLQNISSCSEVDAQLDVADGGGEMRLQPEAVPAFSDDDPTEDDFEPKIITDPNLKPKVDLEANKRKVVRSRYIIDYWTTIIL